MDIDFQLIATPEHISLDVPLAHLKETIANIAWYDTRTNRIFDIGTSEQQMQFELGEKWAQVQSQTYRGAIFTEANARLGYDFLEYQTVLAHLAIRPNPTIQSFTWAWGIDRFNYYLQIEGYDLWKLGQRIEFEGLLQARLKVNRVEINGRSTGIPLWKRRLEAFVRNSLITYIPFVILVYGLLVSGHGKNTLAMASLALASWLVAFLAASVGKFLWATTLPKLVPYEYLLYHASRPAFGVGRKWISSFLETQVVRRE